MDLTSTPCVAICQIDFSTGYCIGCGRTGLEIGDWAAMGEPARLALMARLPERFQEIDGLAAAREAFEARMVSRVRTGRRRRV